MIDKIAPLKYLMKVCYSETSSVTNTHRYTPNKIPLTNYIYTVIVNLRFPIKYVLFIRFFTKVSAENEFAFYGNVFRY